MVRNASVHRIDERVIFVMIALIAVSSLVLGFRYKNAEPCTDVTIVTRAKNYYTGSLVSFRAEAKGGITYEWNFNDGTKADYNLNSVQHSFNTPGTYLISVIVNGHCEGFDTVEIQEAPILKRPLLNPEFIAPDTAIVNKPVTFEDTTNDAVSWEWRFGESNIVDNTSKIASCTYKTPGPKTIYLKINGRSDRVFTRTIYVKDAEPLIHVDQPKTRQAGGKSFGGVPKINDTPKVQPGFGRKLDTGNFAPPVIPKVYTDVQADEMIILIQGVVSGEKKVADFSQYLCDGMNIPVTYNGTPMKFSQMCTLLRDYKKVSNISKPEVQLIKNSSTNCIKTMIVNVNKRTRLEKIFGKQK
jgi:hypothetical protein